jgi:hypothetical protein
VKPREKKKKKKDIVAWELLQGESKTKRENKDFRLGGSTRNETT